MSCEDRLAFRNLSSSLHFLLWNCYLMSPLLRTFPFPPLLPALPLDPLFLHLFLTVTIRFRLYIIFLTSSTSSTNLATSVYPLHLNTMLPFLLAQGMVHPRCRTVSNSYSRNRPDACWPQVSWPQFSFSAPSFRSVELFVRRLKNGCFSPGFPPGEMS